MLVLFLWWWEMEKFLKLYCGAHDGKAFLSLDTMFGYLVRIMIGMSSITLSNTHCRVAHSVPGAADLPGETTGRGTQSCPWPAASFAPGHSRRRQGLARRGIH